MKIIAKNNCVWVVRDLEEFEKNGIHIPDTAKKKPHKGKIIAVGKLVEDKSIVVGETAVFNKTSGFEIELEGITYTVLRGMDVVGSL